MNDAPDASVTSNATERQTPSEITEPVSEPGVKHDDAKPRWSLLPWAQVERVVDVLTFGARKYEVDNWKRVPNARVRYFNAAMRHLLAWHRGERNDSESGLPHIAHAVCCLLFLAWFDDNAAGREGR